MLYLAHLLTKILLEYPLYLWVVDLIFTGIIIICFVLLFYVWYRETVDWKKNIGT